MKPRSPGFLSERYIDHDGEIFDYIRELHAYLWRFMHVTAQGASGDLEDYIDPTLAALEAEALPAGDSLGGLLEERH